MIHTIINWLAVQTGTNIPPQGSHQYNFWSGWGSVFVLPVIITLGHYLVDRFTHTCHVPGCYRKGKHPMAGGKYIVCAKHHPDISSKRTHMSMLREDKKYKEEGVI